MSKKIVLNGADLNLRNIFSFLKSDHKSIKIEISEENIKKINRSRQFVLDSVDQGKVFYGISTGFGSLSNKVIPTKDLVELQYNLIRSHCCGLGPNFSIKIARLIMLLRANCLIQGFSGVDLSLIQRMVDYINLGITPVIPQKGSVGASGDLAPLAHFALTLIGEGEVFYEESRYPTKDLLKKLNITPCVLGPKDGLGLINGTTVMCALAAYAWCEGDKILIVANYAGALTVDGIQGSKAAFDPRIHAIRPHKGQMKIAQDMTDLLDGSEIMESHRNCDKVQDAYSLRCIPQVHGATLQVWDHAKSIIEIEMNSVTDNPIILADTKEVISGGNFHGQPLALLMDYMAIAISELASISERRVEKMMNPTFSNLPAFLSHNPGPESGFMIAHVTAAALVSENKILSHPASVDSIPTSTDKEDHVSMGVHAGRKLLEIIDNVRNSLSIEIICAAQAIDFQRPKKTSARLEAFHKKIREIVPHLKKDRILSIDIVNISDAIRESFFND